MAKKPKQKQTEWNKQGKAIADTSVPYYQSNLTRIDNYLQDPSASIDNYLKKYYDNTTEQGDFIRNYNRAMAGTTAQNYNATGGGYDSSNQRLYDDRQRYMNDWAARLRDKGISTSANMAYQDYANMLNANQAYQNAYALGRPYSDTDQYNYMVGQTNKWYNQLGGLLGTAGAAVGGVLGGGVGSTIGASLGNTLGSAFTTDFGASAGSAYPYANMGTNAILGYYNQKANIPTSNQAIRSEGSDTTAQGQYANPQQMTTNYFNNNTRLNPIQDGELMRRLRERGLA